MKVGNVICPNCGNEVSVTAEGVCEICREDLSANVTPSETYEKLTSIETWFKALTAPSEKTFKQIVNQPGASTVTAASWLFFSGWISSIIGGIYEINTSTEPLAPDDVTPIYEVLIVPVFGSIGWVIRIMIIVGIFYLFSRLFGGKGSYGKILYGFAAFQAPLFVMLSVVNLISDLTWVSIFDYVNIIIFSIIIIVIYLYGLFLTVITIKVVNKFSWGRATICTFTPLTICGLLFCYFLFADGVLFA